MQGIPWFSTFTLFTEAVVTVAVLNVIYSAYKSGNFKYRLAGAALLYETFFNISYMAYRALNHRDSQAHPDSNFHIGLAIFHGTFSLLMFLLLLIFMFYAWKGYRQNVNFFEKYKKLTLIFVIAWMIAVISGFTFYYEAYFSPEEVLTRQKS